MREHGITRGNAEIIAGCARLQFHSDAGFHPTTKIVKKKPQVSLEEKIAFETEVSNGATHCGWSLTGKPANAAKKCPRALGGAPGSRNLEHRH